MKTAAWNLASDVNARGKKTRFEKIDNHVRVTFRSADKVHLSVREPTVYQNDTYSSWAYFC